MQRSLAVLVVAMPAFLALLGQAPAMPNLDAQRAAMKKLAFLTGKWSGEARIFRSGETLEVSQSEEVRYKLDGLLLEIEGIGIRKLDAKPALQALGIISYDDAAGIYHMRAFNDGRWLETDVKLTGDKELSWGFTLGEYRTLSVLRINEKGEWTENHELTHGSQEPVKLMGISVRRQR